MQLQGELVKGGGEKVYKNVFDCFAKNWRNEGIRGIQRGLPPAVSFVVRLLRLFSKENRSICTRCVPRSSCFP